MTAASLPTPFRSLTMDRPRTVRDTLTFDPAVLERLRDLTVHARHHGMPQATKGDVVGMALDLLEAEWADRAGLAKIPRRPDGYDLKTGPRTGGTR